MDEYIERERLLRRFNIDDMMNVNGTLISLEDARNTISNFPAADVMEVTRCKDCEHSYKDPAGLCCSYGACLDCLVPEYYFCFHGEKRRSGNDKT